MQKPLVTFIVITYLEEWEPYMFIGMLKCLKNPLWKAIIWHDAPNPRLKKIIEDFGDQRIMYMESENRGSWGAYNRIDALKMVDTEFVVQSTIQEYFIPSLIDEIQENKENDFIYWPILHYQSGYNILNSEPRVNHIDWSSFAIKTHIARKVGINYPTSYTGDGLFVEDCFKSNLIKRFKKVNKVLNIKN